MKSENEEETLFERIMLLRMIEWKIDVRIGWMTFFSSNYLMQNLWDIRMIKLFCMSTNLSQTYVSFMVLAQILQWSLKVMRVAVLKCDAKTQSKILQKGVEHLFDTTSHHPEEEMDWSIALVASVIVSLWPSAVIPNKQTVLVTLMRAAQSEKPFLITETAAQAVASMLNKWVAVSTDEVGWGSPRIQCILQQFQMTF